MKANFYQRVHAKSGRSLVQEQREGETVKHFLFSKEALTEFAANRVATASRYRCSWCKTAEPTGLIPKVPLLIFANYNDL